VHAVSERFGIEHVVVVGDRGMITQAHVKTLTEQGIEFITPLKAVQVRALVKSGDLQLSRFDSRG
jgi:transposase